jgi:hypothetical protein
MQEGHVDVGKFGLREKSSQVQVQVQVQVQTSRVTSSSSRARAFGPSPSFLIVNGGAGPTPLWGKRGGVLRTLGSRRGAATWAEGRALPPSIASDLPARSRWAPTASTALCLASGTRRRTRRPLRDPGSSFSTAALGATISIAARAARVASRARRAAPRRASGRMPARWTRMMLSILGLPAFIGCICTTATAPPLLATVPRRSRWPTASCSTCAAGACSQRRLRRRSSWACETPTRCSSPVGPPAASPRCMRPRGYERSCQERAASR